MLQAPSPSFQRFVQHIEARARVTDRAPRFPRPALAASTVKDLLSRSHAGGLLLTGGRFTGKSTFLRHDLLPALRAEPFLHVIDIDFLAHEDAEPGDVILDALRTELRAYDGVVRRMARKLGLTTFSVGGMQMDISLAEAEDFNTVLKMLQGLSSQSGRRLVFVLDEVQRTLMSSRGSRVLCALTRSVNHLNLGDGPGARVLATGSHEHKLRRMCLGKADPFHGAAVHAFPPLGEDFLAWLHDQLPEPSRPGLSLMSPAFDRLLHRPKSLMDVCQVLRDSACHSRVAVDRVFQLLVEECADEGRAAFLVKLRELPDLSLALAQVMAELGPRFGPLQHACVQRAARKIQALRGWPHPPVLSDAEVGAALEELVVSGLVWRGLGFVFEHARAQEWIQGMATDEDDPAPDLMPGALVAPPTAEAPRLVS